MSSDPSVLRFFVIQAARLAGAGMVAIGLAIAVGRTHLPPPLGVVIALAGLAGFAVVPVALARRWRSPRP